MGRQSSLKGCRIGVWEVRKKGPQNKRRGPRKKAKVEGEGQRLKVDTSTLDKAVSTRPWEGRSTSF